MKFKHKKDMELFFTLHPLLILVLSDMYNWASENNLDFVITETVSTLERDKKLTRISSSHRTKRAADLRVRDWPMLKQNEFKEFFNKKYQEIASISARDYKPRLVVLHDSGHGFHAHIALHSKFSIREEI